MLLIVNIFENQSDFKHEWQSRSLDSELYLASVNSKETSLDFEAK